MKMKWNLTLEGVTKEGYREIGRVLASIERMPLPGAVSERTGLCHVMNAEPLKLYLKEQVMYEDKGRPRRLERMYAYKDGSLARVRLEGPLPEEIREQENREQKIYA